MTHIQSSSQRFLHSALRIGALEIVPEGRRLNSGRVSPYFFNSGLFTRGNDLEDLLIAYVDAFESHPLLGIQDNLPDVIFGPAYKGIPLAVGLTVISDGFDIDLEWAFNRKEAKDHGEGGIIVGASLQGKRVLIADDVMTSGLSSAEAVETVKADGGTPIGVLIAFDRQEVGQDGQLSAVQEFERKFEIPVAAAATLADLLAYLRQIGHEGVSVIERYQAQYGATI